MELVYLYVKEYNNIKNQGFTFSPRFTVDFKPELDKNGKIVGGDLKVEENKEYQSIFPPNINITAIVGKNGSGKSSISEVIATFSFQEYLDKKSFLLFFNGKSFSVKQSGTGKELSFKIINKTQYKFDKKNKERTIDIVYFSNDVATIFNNPKLRNIQQYNNIDAFYNYQTNCMPNNNYLFYKEKIDRLETFSDRFKNLLNEDINIFKTIDEKIKFDVYQNELHFYEMGVYFVSDDKLLELLGKKKLEKITILDDAMNSKSHLYKLIILFRLIRFEQSTQKDISDIVPKIKESFQKTEFSIYDLNIINEIISKFDNLNEIYTIENINALEARFEFTKNEIWKEKKLYKLNEIYTESNELIKLLLSKLNRVNFLSSIDKEYNYYSLSSGEREYISIFTAYCHHLKRLAQGSSPSNNEFIFYFDEIELGLHPNWQKSIVKDLIYFAKKYLKKNIQLILTSHSTFILSDIPKQNIIFLKDGKNVSDKVDINTFGANIHTLLSHGFFMDDGLMGEFAKSKIDNVIKILNNPKSGIKDLDEAQRYVDIIGEPIIKRQLQKMIDSKKLFSIDNEIEDLKKRLEILEKQKENKDV